MDDKLKNLTEHRTGIYHPQADYRQPLSVLPVIGIGKIRRDYPSETRCVLHRGCDGGYND